MSDQDSASASAHFARAQLLRTQHRIQDAIAQYKMALGLDPNHTASYVMLALCWMEEDSTAAQSLDAARRAVALEPEEAFARSVLALAMNANARDGQTGGIKEALKQAEEAVNLDPDSDFSHAVVARLHLRLRDYAKAEAAARQALALNVENSMATEALSAALLLQRKSEDNKGLISYQLQRDADDDSAHTSAGWQALMEGKHKQANQHFTEALRLNPMNEGARLGLVESYRARSYVYRLQLRFSNFMNQFTEGKQNAIMIGGFVAYQVLRSLLRTVSPFWTSVLIGAWLLFALWSHLARGFGGFFLVMDRFARQALKPRDYWEGVVVGGLIFLALAALVAGFVLRVPSSDIAALACLFAAVANAAAFTNDHHVGRHVYAAAAALAAFGAVYFGIDVFGHLPLPAVSTAGSLAILIGVAMSWLRPLRVLYA
jgi:tetratricopeptide (TPR) repeat protein